MSCGECARAELFVHAAEVERDRYQLIVAELQRKLAEAEQTIKTLEKRKK